MFQIVRVFKPESSENIQKGSSKLDHRGNPTGEKLTKAHTYIGIVVEICPPKQAELEKNEHSGDFFKVSFPNNDFEELTKGELCALLDMDHHDELERVDKDSQNPNWRLFKDLTSYITIATAHFMSDVHQKTQVLSKFMQTNGVPLADVDSQIRRTVNDLEMLLKIPGPSWTKFQSQFNEKDNTWLGLVLHGFDKEAFEQFQRRVISATTLAIKTRFMENDPFILDMRVINNLLWPIGGIVIGTEELDRESEWGRYGNDEIQRIATHYHELLGLLDLDDDEDTSRFTIETKILNEWYLFKSDIILGSVGIEKVRTESYSVFWSFMSAHYGKRYPWLLSVVTIIRLIPIGSAECERVFSAMNRLKSEMRNRLSNDRLNDLLTVNRLAPKLRDISDSLLDELISHWSVNHRATRYFS